MSAYSFAMSNKVSIMIRFFTVCLILVAATAQPARAGILEPLLRFPTFPECHDASVLNRIAQRFNWAQDKTFDSHVRIDALKAPHPSKLRVGQDEAIPRLYCRARAELNTGQHRTVFYLIEGGVGFAGNGSHVAFCVEGYDPWRVYNGSCRSLRY